MLLKIIAGLFVAAGLFTIIFPPRILGSHGPKVFIGLALAALVLVFFADQRLSMIPVESVRNDPVRDELSPEVQAALSRPLPPLAKPPPPVQQSLKSPPSVRQSLMSGEREVVRVSAMNLFREYQQNEVATDLRLKGKIIDINGKITGISKDFLDNAYVSLQTSNEFMHATVHPVGEDIEKVAQLRKGRIVTFRCDSMMRFMGSPSGKNCILMD